MSKKKNVSKVEEFQEEKEAEKPKSKISLDFDHEGYNGHLCDGIAFDGNGDTGGGDEAIELSRQEDRSYITVFDRNQLLRAVLNKSFPQGSFIHIDMKELEREARGIGLKPGRDAARGIIVFGATPHEKEGE